MLIFWLVDSRRDVEAMTCSTQTCRKLCTADHRQRRCAYLKLEISRQALCAAQYTEVHQKDKRMQTVDLSADDVEMDNDSADAVYTQQSWFTPC